MPNVDSNLYNPSEGGVINVSETVTVKDWGNSHNQKLLLVNDGDNKVYVNIDGGDVGTDDFFLASGESLTIETTVHRVALVCGVGNTSSVRYLRR